MTMSVVRIVTTTITTTTTTNIWNKRQVCHGFSFVSLISLLFLALSGLGE